MNAIKLNWSSRWRLLIIPLLCGVFMSVQSQAQVTFQYTYGWNAGDERGAQVVQTTDGGYAFLSTTLGSIQFQRDVLLTKVGPGGVVQWTKSYGTANTDFAYGLIQTSDGGFLIGAEAWGLNGGAADMLLIKTFPNGDEQWIRTYGGAIGDNGGQVLEDANGDFLMTGWVYETGTIGTSYDVVAVKFSPTGAFIWARHIDSGGSDRGHAIKNTSDGGYILAGTGAHGINNSWMIKLTNAGGVDWTASYGNLNSDYFADIIQTADGGYVAVGARNYHANFVGWETVVLKTDSLGNFLWSKLIGGNNEDIGLAVEELMDGSLMICGLTESFGAGGRDAYLMKLTATGNLIWARTYGEPTNELGVDFVPTADDGFILVGSHNANSIIDKAKTYLIKTDQNGVSGCNEMTFNPWVRDTTYTRAVNHTAYLETLHGSWLNMTNPQTLPDSLICINCTITLTFSVTNPSCAFGADGSIDLTVSGGSGLYTYDWDNGETTEDINNLTAGTYTVIVTDDAGCQEVISITLTDPPVLQFVNGLVTPASCVGSCDGEIDIEVIGGTLPYTYSWTGPGGPYSTEDLTGLCAGHYDLVVTDDNGCQIFIGIGVAEPEPIILNYTVRGETCTGNNDGSIDLHISGGVGPYNTSWFGPNIGCSVGEDLCDLGAGTYVATVTDDNGCTATISVDVDDLSQTATWKFQKGYGEDGNEWGNGGTPTSDGGYIIAGTSAGSSSQLNNEDLYVVKIDCHGAIEWSYIYGTGATDRGRHVIEASNGDFIVVGSTDAFSAGSLDALMVRLDPNGFPLWAKTYGGDQTDGAEHVAETDDGGFIFTGHTWSFNAQSQLVDVYCVKTFANGDVDWARAYGSHIDSESGHFISQTSDGGYIIAGSEGGPQSFSGGFFTLVKVRADGFMQWFHSYDWATSIHGDGGFSVVETQSGHFLAVGTSLGMTTTYVMLVQTDLNGTFNWSNLYTVPGKNSMGIDIKQTGDGGFIIGGLTETKVGGNTNGLLMKLDAQYVLEWAREYGDTEDDYLVEVHLHDDGGYFAVGSEQSYTNTSTQEQFVIKTDALGRTGCETTVFPVLTDITNQIQEDFGAGIYQAGPEMDVTHGFYQRNNLAEEIVECESLLPCHVEADAGPDKTICPGWCVSLGTPNDPSYTYLWYHYPDNLLYMPIVEDGKHDVICVKPSGTTVYYLVVTDASGNCVATDFVTVTVLPPDHEDCRNVAQSIQGNCCFGDGKPGGDVQITIRGALNLAPNPVSTQLVVAYDFAAGAPGSGGFPTSGEIAIQDQLGVLLRSENVQNVQGQITMDVHNLTPGMYYVLLRDGLGQVIETQTLIVN